MFNWLGAKAGRAAIFGLIAGLGIGGAVGFGLGVYFLPILTAGPGLDQAALQALATSAERRGRFIPDLPGSDALDMPPAIDLDEYDAVVIWCEAFKQFITAARLEN